MNSTNILHGVRMFAKFLTVITFLILVVAVFIATPAQRNTFNPFELNFYDSIMLIVFYLILLSLFLSWWYEGLGGIMAIAGLIIYVIFDYISGAEILWNILVLAIPASLFIFCWWYTDYSEDYNIYRE